MIFIHLDGDDIGPVLELLLLDNGVERARSYSASVARALELVREELVSYGDVDIFAVGGDDLAAVLPDDFLDMQRIDKLREIFFETCGRTMSAGLGYSPCEATRNLRRAKLMGKNLVVTPSMVAQGVVDVEA